MKNVDGPKTEDEEALQNSIYLWERAIAAFEDLQNHPAGTGYERDVAEDLLGDVRKMKSGVVRRQALAGIPLEEIGHHLEDAMESLEQAQEELPDEDRIEEVEDLFRMNGHIESAMGEAYEARATVSDLEEDQ